ncbi:hypothetical protein RFH42_03070 [Acinetobacter rudis]|uniref:hypothetical protein n=1 Tax=Acinetobacter rudis TaxID=632955 RepID=UPI00280E10F9|nr:hypothetical protein [Acinetobacter rudis]MDQ8951935.1 hypothetical protein [Acinetobacter rudis]
MSIDNLLDRTWSNEYTCNEFAIEAWKQITGENIDLRSFETANGKQSFEILNKPISPCIVYMTNNNRSSTHVGLFYCDKLLHLTPCGVQFIPLEMVKNHFREVRFYK